MSNDGPSSFEISNQIQGSPSNSQLRSGGNSVGAAQGGPSVDSMTASLVNLGADLSAVTKTEDINHPQIFGEGIAGQSIFKFADEAGKVFAGNIETGALAPALQHEFSEEKAGLGKFSAGSQLGAEKGVSQGLIGRESGG